MTLEPDLPAVGEGQRRDIEYENTAAPEAVLGIFFCSGLEKEEWSRRLGSSAP